VNSTANHTTVALPLAVLCGALKDMDTTIFNVFN
jgi:hypothetical protein